MPSEVLAVPRQQLLLGSAPLYVVFVICVCHLRFSSVAWRALAVPVQHCAVDRKHEGTVPQSDRAWRALETRNVLFT